MRAAFWIRRVLPVFAFGFLIIAGAAALKGHPRREAASHGFLWSAISTGIFASTGVYKSRKGQRCALCGDPSGIRQA